MVHRAWYINTRILQNMISGISLSMYWILERECEILMLMCLFGPAVILDSWTCSLTVGELLVPTHAGCKNYPSSLTFSLSLSLPIYLSI